MLQSRFLLVLVVAAFLCTPASANSAPVNTASFHFGTSVYDQASTFFPSDFSINGGKATAVTMSKSNSHVAFLKTNSGMISWIESRLGVSGTMDRRRRRRWLHRSLAACCCSRRAWSG